MSETGSFRHEQASGNADASTGGSPMTINMTYDEQAKALITTITDTITFHEMLSHNEDVASALRSSEIHIRIMDLRGLTAAEIDTDQLDALAQSNLQVILDNPVKDLLVLASGDLQYGLCRMWEAFARLGDQELRIFRTKEALNAYLADKYGLERPLL